MQRDGALELLGGSSPVPLHRRANKAQMTLRLYLSPDETRGSGHQGPKMDTETLKIVGQVAGIGGLALGVFLLLYREMIRRLVFPNLNRRDAFRIIIIFMVLVWSIAVIGIGAWVWAGANKGTSSTPASITLRDVRVLHPDRVRPAIPNLYGYNIEVGMEVVVDKDGDARVDACKGEFISLQPHPGTFPNTEINGNDNLTEVSFERGACSEDGGLQFRRSSLCLQRSSGHSRQLQS